MNLDAIPAIDTHAHPFSPTQGAVSSQWLRDALSESLTRPATAATETTMLSRMVAKALGKLLGCSPTWPEVLDARNALAAADPVAYNHLLFTNAGIAGVLIDPGFPTEFIKPTDFAAVLPCPVVEGYRIERFVDSALNPADSASRHRSLQDAVQEFRMILDNEAANPQLCFYKSVIAYHTGLEIPVVSEADALAAWAAMPVDGTPANKVLRDFFFWETALKAKEHDLAFQVHTGHTSESIPWARVNPINLTHLFNQPEMADVRFVLVHGGYPYCTEAGYITSVYPNISLDLSLMIPWSSIGITRRIEETLEIAPVSKVMYGSDGIMVPELFWISALNTRKALGRVLDRLITEEVLDSAEAEEVARDIFYRNAERIYRLSFVSG